MSENPESGTVRKIQKKSDFEKGIIIGRFKCGMTIMEIAEAEGVPRSTVGYIIKKYVDTGTVANRKPPGRPKAAPTMIARLVGLL
ncbi:hypothetical protein CLU79DRAFT_838431 [Phycomyces nitens]|nr:hypothetical protein CLU79DRAFT_838431 [Phycomyces nitens]